MAYQDEHRALREIVDRIGGLEVPLPRPRPWRSTINGLTLASAQALAANPGVHRRIEAIERIQHEHAASPAVQVPASEEGAREPGSQGRVSAMIFNKNIISFQLVSIVIECIMIINSDCNKL